MRSSYKYFAILRATLGLPCTVFASSEDNATNPGNWCEWYGSKPGIIFSDPDNPFFQELQIEGRFQYQIAHLEGENIAGTDWTEDYDEFRRLRVGIRMKFLQYFASKYQLNLVNSTRPFGGDLNWGYDSIEDAYISFDLGKALGDTGLDELSLIYGVQKYVFSTEAHESSGKLLTVERSALSNKLYGGFRPTGLTISGVKNQWSIATSIFSSTTDGSNNKEFNGWQDSYFVLLNLGYQVSDELLLRIDAVKNDADPSSGDDSVLNYAWSIGFGAEYDAGEWGVNADVIYGDNGDAEMQTVAARRGQFYGFQVMPYCWLIDKKLQLVGQYQWQGADGAEGVRINTRYGRAEGSFGINDGRGDSHHSFYTGLNYYLCGHSAKIQAGIEYQTMDAPTGDFDTLTYVLGFRTYF